MAKYIIENDMLGRYAMDRLIKLGMSRNETKCGEGGEDLSKE